LDLVTKYTGKDGQQTGSLLSNSYWSSQKAAIRFNKQINPPRWKPP